MTEFDYPEIYFQGLDIPEDMQKNLVIFANNILSWAEVFTASGDKIPNRATFGEFEDTVCNGLRNAYWLGQKNMDK